MEADYPNDKDLLAKFFREHTILNHVSRGSTPEADNSIDEDILFEPARDADVMRVNCYSDHFQHIRDRQFYTNSTDDDTNNNSSLPSSSSRTFIVEVPIDEIYSWNNTIGEDLASRIENNTLRYHELCCTAVDEILESLPSRLADNMTDADALPVRDTVDVLHEHRIAQQAAATAHNAGHANSNDTNNNNNNNTNNTYLHAGTSNLAEENTQAQAQAVGGATEAFPPLLMRRYELRILPRGRKGILPPFVHQYLQKKMREPTVEHSLRQIRSRSIGKLVTIKGMLVRCSDVKPACAVATYSCDSCGAELYQVVHKKREFMPPRHCPTEACRKRTKASSENTLQLQTRGSKFVKYQECKLQELPSQVPMGHVPRSMSVLCRGELTRMAGPGDIVTVDGVYLSQRVAESGYGALKAGLVTTSYLEAQNIVVHKKSFDEASSEHHHSHAESLMLQAAVEKIATGPDPIGKLASSIAPEIFGHEDIKRALLLQLVGGCTRKLPDGMKIRGDINICLMGDPGVAKSQLLKHVASITPRGVYTTGKGSSGVGLTASVTKDLATGEMALEGGALVLADQGVCCIDEFDKMDETDRTAIHEVMEQQTVSIAKAGIVATLNARTAVLAAANPLYGRYNARKSLSENINLPNSLLSRFDLMFLVLDHADVDRDIALARHVTSVHKNQGIGQSNGLNVVSDDPDDDSMFVEPQVLREYIVRARQYLPYISPQVAPYVVEAYTSLRSSSIKSGRLAKKSQSDQTAMTARQLLSIMRLSQALARLRFSSTVVREDVDEAIRLTHTSKSSLENNNSNNSGTAGNRDVRKDVISKVFSVLRDHADILGKQELDLATAGSVVVRKGYTQQQLDKCLEEYETLGIIQIDQSRTHLYF